jgi:hypothetical protein
MRGFNDKLFGDKLVAGQLPINLGLIGSQTVLLLDLYPNAAAAYSLRKLRAAYTGNAIRVRRTDLTESNIGFTAAGNLDTTALLAFTGTGALDDGFITTWYDQSGNARNFTQSTAINQPKIVNAGSVLTSNGEPIIDFNGTNSYMNGAWSSFFTSTTDNFSIFNVLKYDVSNVTQIPFGVTNGVGSAVGSIDTVLHSYGSISTDFYRVNGSITSYSTSIATEFGTTNDNLIVFQKNGAVTNVYNNNTFKATETFSSTLLGNVPTDTSFFLRIGTNRGYLNNWFNGNMKEMIIYPSSQSSNLSGINSNINTYYAIY